MLEPALFKVSGPPTLPEKAGGGSVRRVDPASRPPGTFFELSGPPPRFSDHSRYAVVPPQGATTTDPARRNSVVAGVSDVFVRGPDIIVVDQGATLGGVPAFPEQPGAAKLDLGAVGSATVLPWLGGNELRVSRPNGHYVRLAGTVPVSELAAVGRDLHPVEGGQLVVLDNG